MKAIGKNILVSEINEEVVTDFGLLLTDKSDVRYGKARVVHSGSECGVVSDGDTVYYDKRSAFGMVIEGVRYTIIQERDVVVVV